MNIERDIEKKLQGYKQDCETTKTYCTHNNKINVRIHLAGCRRSKTLKRMHSSLNSHTKRGKKIITIFLNIHFGLGHPRNFHKTQMIFRFFFLHIQIHTEDE